MTDTVPSLRKQVAAACHVLAAAGLDDMVWGHVSARDPSGRGVWMKAHELGFEELTEDNVLLVSWDGEVLAGDGRRHGEYPIHTELAVARPDVNAVVHSHALQCVAFAATGRPMLPISQETTRFFRPGVPRFTREGGDLVLTRELGQELARSLGDARAALLPCHGIVAVGESVPVATMTASWLNMACATLLLAGDVKHWASDEDALSKGGRLWSPRLSQIAWDYWVRRVNASTR